MSKKPLKPMKARSETLTDEDIEGLEYPVYVSPKLDGMRVMKLDGQTWTNNLNPVANDHVRTWIENNVPEGCDGELCLPNMTEPLEQVMSAFRSVKGKPEFVFAAFDVVQADKGFAARLDYLKRAQRNYESRGVQGTGSMVIVPQILVESPEELHDYTAQFLEMGYEGLMVRSPGGKYKAGGRSTLREGWLLKFKPWHDEEGTIVDVEEEMTNHNEDRTSTGARSTAKAGKVPTGRAGALVFEFDDGTRSSVGGLTDVQKETFWAEHRDANMVGRRITVKYQAVRGGRAPGEKPRHPQLKGFRDDV